MSLVKPLQVGSPQHASTSGHKDFDHLIMYPFFKRHYFEVLYLDSLTHLVATTSENCRFLLIFMASEDSIVEKDTRELKVIDSRFLLSVLRVSFIISSFSFCSLISEQHPSSSTLSVELPNLTLDDSKDFSDSKGV